MAMATTASQGLAQGERVGSALFPDSAPFPRDLSRRGVPEVSRLGEQCPGGVTEPITAGTQKMDLWVLSPQMSLTPTLSSIQMHSQEARTQEMIPVPVADGSPEPTSLSSSQQARPQATRPGGQARAAAAWVAQGAGLLGQQAGALAASARRVRPVERV